MIRLSFLLLFIFSRITQLQAQCIPVSSTVSYREDFESSNGGWFSGGTGNDWAWGAPAKPVINAAGSGLKCWVVGGLSGSVYTNSEASWLQSPCFDFTNLQYPYIEFRVFWEMEQQFDGGSLQYSIDNGSTWIAVGSINSPVNCLNANWYNYSPITYLAPLSSTREGWSGNIQSSAGSCRGGNGSNGWVTAKQTMPYLAGKSNVLFRFVFGAGAICNNYDGFSIDDVQLKEATPNNASFNYTCINSRIVNFTNTSLLCPTGFSWNFGDPSSGTSNISNIANPSHLFSGPGKYTVTLTATGPDNAPSAFTNDVTIIDVSVAVLRSADCQTNTGGSLAASIIGSSAPLNFIWNTTPAQTSSIAINLAQGSYNVIVSGAGVCPDTGTGIVKTDFSCIGIYFPSAFTPNNNGLNDYFGPLGSLSALSNFQLSVYNRWGEKVFYSTNPLAKWNGKVNGLDTDSNIYVWYASFSLSGNPKEFRKGTLMLIR